MALTQESYLKPQVIQQVKRLDLRAKFIIEGFLSGLHASPFHGFSSEFSEHLRYNPGDDIARIDWNVYARTDRFFIKKYQAETNLICYLIVDLSASMDYTYEQELTKLDYSICLASALTYLMIRQADAVGVVTFDERVQASLKPKSRKTQLTDIIGLLSTVRPSNRSDIAASLHQVASMIRQKSLIIVFSDLLPPEDEVREPEEFAKQTLQALQHLRHGGNDVIIFHILDQAEVEFPFQGPHEFHGKEVELTRELDASGLRASYLEALSAYCALYRTGCAAARIDYMPIHTGQPFDRALMDFLLNRQSRF